jgi:hypothetical protein
LRLWRIDSLPPGFHFDESFEGLEAWRILTIPEYHPIFLSGNFGVPALNAYANAFMFSLAPLWGGEPGPTTMRVTAALFGVIGVLLVYLLGRELYRLDKPEQKLGLSLALPFFAATVLAVMRWHLHFSRMGIEPIIVPAIWAASMWLLLRGWRSGNSFAFAGCGIFLAAGMYTYQAAWIIPFLALAVLLVLAWHDRASFSGSGRPGVESSSASDPRLGRKRLTGLLIAGGIALILVAPLALYFLQNPDLIFLRPTQLAIVGDTGSSGDSTIGANIRATAKMFGPFGLPGDLDPRRNLPGAPALNLWLALPFYFGLALSLWRLRRPAYAILLIGLVGLLLPGVFSEYAPHFHRILGAAAPVALICAVGLDWLWSWQAGGERSKIWGRALQGVAILLVVLGARTGMINYFQRWAALPDLFYAFDAGLWEVGEWIATSSPDGAVYLSPRAIDHPTLAFAWRESNVKPVSFDGRHIFPHTLDENSRAEAYVVIEHEDFRTRLLLPELFPDATISHEILDDAGQVYARAYTRQEQSAARRNPTTTLDVPLDDDITLDGYDLFPWPARAGEPLYVQLYWSILGKPTEDWTIYLHLTDPDNPGAIRAGHDSRPGSGSLPTSEWQSGWRILDEYQLPLPADLPSGEYSLYGGLYTAAGERLPAHGEGFELGTVRVE